MGLVKSSADMELFCFGCFFLFFSFLLLPSANLTRTHSIIKATCWKAAAKSARQISRALLGSRGPSRLNGRRTERDRECGESGRLARRGAAVRLSLPGGLQHNAGGLVTVNPSSGSGGGSTRNVKAVTRQSRRVCACVAGQSRAHFCLSKWRQPKAELRRPFEET